MHLFTSFAMLDTWVIHAAPSIKWQLVTISFQFNVVLSGAVLRPHNIDVTSATKRPSSNLAR